MFSIYTFLVIIMLVIICGYIIYRVSKRPLWKKSFEEDDLMSREKADYNINATSPFKTHMEFSQEINEGEKKKKQENKYITFEPLSFFDSEDTEIVLLPKNPNWIYTYWNIYEKTVLDFENSHGKGTWDKSYPLLIIKNHTERTTFELGINDFANNWYIKVDKPGNKFSVTLARRFPDGRLIVLAVSNIIKTPVSSISSVLDENWLPIDEIWKEFKGFSIGNEKTYSSDFMQ